MVLVLFHLYNTYYFTNQARRTKTILNASFDKRLTDDEKKGVEYNLHN